MATETTSASASATSQVAPDVDYSNDPLIAAAMQVTNDAHSKVQQAEADLAAERLEQLSLRQETSTSPSRKRLSVISNTSGVSPSRLPQRPPSVTSNASSAISSRSGTKSSTNKRASIVPRPTRASLLRQGGDAPPPARGANSTVSKRMSVGPGVTLSFKERQPIEVKSTKAPSIAPRMTKAAALRSGGPQAPSGTAFGSALNASAPRHRRTDSEPAASSPTPSYTPASGVNRDAVKATKAPKIAPRMTKAAQLRGAGGPPSSSSPTLAPKRRPASMIVTSKSQPPAGFI